MIKRPLYGSYHLGRHACASDLQLIDGAFATHMRECGYSLGAMARYRYFGSIAEFVGKSGKRVLGFEPAERRELGLDSRRSARFNSRAKPLGFDGRFKRKKWLAPCSPIRQNRV